jgi:hypothetical protein
MVAISVYRVGAWHLAPQWCGGSQAAAGGRGGRRCQHGFTEIERVGFAVMSLTAPGSNPCYAHMGTAPQPCWTHSRPSLRCAGA